MEKIKVAEVLVCRELPKPYSYHIPDDFPEDLKPGNQIEVPLGRSKAPGVILNISQSEPQRNLKPISQVLSKKPILSAEQIDLIFWLKDTYLLSPFRAYQTVMGPFSLRKRLPEETSIKTKKAGYALTSAQKKVIDTIWSKRHDPIQDYLLFGVTASGKTEIYMQLAQRVLSEKKGALLLLPEIALTPPNFKPYSRNGSVPL